MKKYVKKVSVIILALLVSLAMVMPVSAASVSLNRRSASVTVGKTVKLKVKGTRKKAKWSSSNSKIATVNKNGVVKDIKVHQKVIQNIVIFANKLGFKIINLTYSPIKGPAGNIEYLLYIEKNENTNENNNINDDKNGTIRFVHEETVPVNEYPEIQVIRTTGEQDVTILSLNLNGDEIFWHQEGDTLVFDQPITAKENTVKVIAVIDGRRIVHMPIWEF